MGVVGQEGHFFGQALGDKDAVEGIAVVKRKVDCAANVAPLDGKGAGHAVVDPFLSQAFQSTQQIEFFDGDLDS